MASQRLGEMKGEISTETVPRMQVEWEVPENIIFLPRDTDHRIHSPSFHFKGATWYLRLKIHARELQASEYLVDPIHLYLVKKYSASTVLRVIYHIGIKGHSGNEYKRSHSELPIAFNERDEDCWGEFSLFDKSKLSRRKASQAPSGVVRFFCHFWVETAENSYSASRTSLSGVQSTIVSNQLSENIGEISAEVLTTMYVEWKVPDIHLLSEDTKHRISSSSFQFKDEVWYLQAIIHDTEFWSYRRVAQQNGPIDIHLMRKECISPTLYVEYSIGLKMIDGNICNVQHNEYVFDTNSDCRILTYLSRLDEKIMHSANGAVTFFFYFRVESSGCSNAGFQKIPKGLDYKSPPTLNISGSSASNQMHITDTTLEAMSALKISGESTNKKSSKNQTIIPAANDVPRSSNRSILGQTRENDSSSAAVNVPRSSNRRISGHTMSNQSTSAALSFGRSNANTFRSSACNQSTSTIITFESLRDRSTFGNSGTDQSTSSDFSFGNSSNTRTEYDPWSSPGYRLGTASDLQLSRSSERYQTLPRVVTFESSSDTSTFGHSAPDQSTSSDFGFGTSSNTHTSGSSEDNPWSSPAVRVPRTPNTSISGSSSCQSTSTAVSVPRTPNASISGFTGSYKSTSAAVRISRTPDASISGSSVSDQSTSAAVSVPRTPNASISGFTGSYQSTSVAVSVPRTPNASISGFTGSYKSTSPAVRISRTPDASISGSSVSDQSTSAGPTSRASFPSVSAFIEYLRSQESRPTIRENFSTIIESHLRSQESRPTIRDSFSTMIESHLRSQESFFPTIRESFDRRTVIPFMSSNQTFGMENSSSINMYCLKCKEKTGTTNYHTAISKNNKLMGKGNCDVCEVRKATFKGKKRY